MCRFSMIYARSSISALLVAGIWRFVPTGPPEPWFGWGKVLGSNLPRLLYETGPKTEEISDNLNVETLPPFSPLKYSQILES